MSKWQNKVIYQIYPKSFQDSNQDGVGDIPGIIRRLDYLKNLGVDIIWLNPIFLSPQVDNGYDISDYYQIDPIFGSMEDVEHLIDEVHQRGMALIFDLVLNHTSDQHPWFQEALKGRENPYRDFYLWETSHKDREEQLPNNWGSFFGGSVWEKEPKTGDYYFHLFAKEMPDLNWENPKVRQAMLELSCFWLKKGIDGFRLDAFIHMGKADFSKQIPGLLAGEVAVKEEFYAHRPEVFVYLEELITEWKKIKPDVFVLGEAASATADLGKTYMDPNRPSCDSIVSFRYFKEKTQKTKENLPEELAPKRLDVSAFKQEMEQWQQLGPDIYPTLYWNNHDMERLVSRFGQVDDYRQESSTCLATLMYLQKGIPVIYYGEEIGMKNLMLTQITDTKDQQVRQTFDQLVAKGYSKETALRLVSHKSREASRGSMQWNSSRHAGFSEIAPWLGVNQESTYNVADQQESASILAYYQHLLQLKKTALFSQGRYHLIPTSDDWYIYRRELENKQAIVICNVTEQQQVLPESLQAKLINMSLELTNYPKEMMDSKYLVPPYGAMIYLKK